MGDLLRELTEADVELLDTSTVVSCPTTLGRHVRSRAARRGILEIYLNHRDTTGSALILFLFLSSVLTIFAF